MFLAFLQVIVSVVVLVTSRPTTSAPPEDYISTERFLTWAPEAEQTSLFTVETSNRPTTENVERDEGIVSVVVIAGDTAQRVPYRVNREVNNAEIMTSSTDVNNVSTVSTSTVTEGSTIAASTLGTTDKTIETAAAADEAVAVTTTTEPTMTTVTSTPSTTDKTTTQTTTGKSSIAKPTKTTRYPPNHPCRLFFCKKPSASTPKSCDCRTLKKTLDTWT